MGTYASFQIVKAGGNRDQFRAVDRGAGRQDPIESVEASAVPRDVCQRLLKSHRLRRRLNFKHICHEPSPFAARPIIAGVRKIHQEKTPEERTAQEDAQTDGADTAMSSEVIRSFRER